MNSCVVVRIEGRRRALDGGDETCGVIGRIVSGPRDGVPNGTCYLRSRCGAWSSPPKANLTPLYLSAYPVLSGTAHASIRDLETHHVEVRDGTRARDHLLITSVAPASEFLDDLRA